MLGSIAPESLLAGAFVGAEPEPPPPLASVAGLPCALPAAGLAAGAAGFELAEFGLTEPGLAEDGLAPAASLAPDVEFVVAPAGCAALAAGDAAGEFASGKLCAAAEGLFVPDPIHGRGCPFHRRYPNPAARTSAINIKANFHPVPWLRSCSSSSSK